MLYRIENLHKSRGQGSRWRLWIRSLNIARGERVAITGPSGCGKSSTLDILGLALKPDSASRLDFAPKCDSIAIMPFWQKQELDTLAALRLAHIGYILQSGELLPYLGTGENILLPARLKGIPEDRSLDLAHKITSELGIAKLWDAMPASLSVGERQRAAIARALTCEPELILADEPTAALDPLHSAKVLEAFFSALSEHGSTLILVTHNLDWARQGGLREISFSLEEDEQGVCAILDDGQPKPAEGRPC